MVNGWWLWIRTSSRLPPSQLRNCYWQFYRAEHYADSSMMAGVDSNNACLPRFPAKFSAITEWYGNHRDVTFAQLAILHLMWRSSPNRLQLIRRGEICDRRGHAITPLMFDLRHSDLINPYVSCLSAEAQLTINSAYWTITSRIFGTSSMHRVIEV